MLSDPVNGIDPSGYMMTLGDLMVSFNNLATISMRVLQIYDGVTTLVDLIVLAYDVKSIVGHISQVGELADLLKNDPYTGSTSYGNKTHTLDLRDALEHFAWNAPAAIAIAIAAPEWGKQMMQKSHKSKNFNINMPVFNNVPKAMASIPTGLRLKFKNKKVPIVITFGNKHNKQGALLGFGVIDTTNRQMYRIDHHPEEKGHGGQGGQQGKELAYWVQGPYHHVMNWNQQDKDMKQEIASRKQSNFVYIEPYYDISFSSMNPKNNLDIFIYHHLML